MGRVIVIGAGIAGLACARELLAGGHTVTVRERSHAVGGRMAAPLVAGRRVDIGASYFTAADPDFERQTQDWCARGLARRWTDRLPALTTTGLSDPKPGPWRYATPAGLGSLVEDLAATPAALPMTLETSVAHVGPGPTVDGELTDAVVLAMPDPQAGRLLDRSLTQVRAQLAGRVWEPVLALVASYSSRSWPEFAGAFINDDPTLGWVADDGRRRGDDAAVLVAHSTSPFAAAHLNAPQEAVPAMVAALDRLLGAGVPEFAHTHRWTFARPAASREQAFFYGADRIGLAGDGWGSPKVETAWLSGRALGRHLAAELAR